MPWHEPEPLQLSGAVHVVLAANEAEKASPVRLVGLGAEGAVGRLRLAGSDAEIDAAVAAIHRALADVPGRAGAGRGRPGWIWQETDPQRIRKLRIRVSA